jgi:AcrR family transcriptional regulator
MPYAKDHKKRTRQRILESAARLFSAKGFEATSIEDVMRECKLTRGGFYAHFRSKGALYQEAMGFVAAAAERQDGSLAGDPTGWLDEMLASLLSPTVAGEAHEARWAFMIADLASKQPEVRHSYGKAFKAMSTRLQNAMSHSPESNQSALAAMAMVVGALTVAITVDDGPLRIQLLTACREHAKNLVEGVDRDKPLHFFWASDTPGSSLHAPFRTAVH